MLLITFCYYQVYFSAHVLSCLDGGVIEVPKPLADVFEAVVGAVYIDSNCNLSTTWEVVKPMLAHLIGESFALIQFYFGLTRDYLNLVHNTVIRTYGKLMVFSSMVTILELKMIFLLVTLLYTFKIKSGYRKSSI